MYKCQICQRHEPQTKSAILKAYAEEHGLEYVDLRLITEPIDAIGVPTSWSMLNSADQQAVTRLMHDALGAKVAGEFVEYMKLSEEL